MRTVITIEGKTAVLTSGGTTVIDYLDSNNELDNAISKLIASFRMTENERNTFGVNNPQPKSNKYVRLDIIAPLMYPDEDGYFATEDGSEQVDTPFFNAEDGLWKPSIDLTKGSFINWPKGIVGDINYKIVDCGIYTFFKEDGTSETYEGYVPKFLSPNEENYGDYITMDVDVNGYISGFEVTQGEIKKLLK